MWCTDVLYVYTIYNIFYNLHHKIIIVRRKKNVMIDIYRHYYLIFVHLAEFLSLVVRYERPQILETRVYRLHTTSLVGVGDLPAHSFFVLHANGHLGRPMANHNRCKTRWRWIHSFLGSVCQARRKNQFNINIF